MIFLITFEGADGSGKTTQIKLLEHYLAAQGKACLCTREPGGTALGAMLRKALLKAGEEEISSSTELFLYLADRAQHVREVIQPALRSGKVVLCDRFTDSTLAYQGYGRGVNLDLLRQLNQIASYGVVPDLTFLFDCPVEVSLSRTARRVAQQRSAKAREDRFEKKEAEFHERVRRGFLELARAEPPRICVLDASRSIQEVHEAVRDVVDRRLLTKGDSKRKPRRGGKE